MCSQCVKVAYCSLVPMTIFFLLMDYSSQFVSQQGCLARDHVSSFLTAWYGLMTDQVLVTGINKSISDISGRCMGAAEPVFAFLFIFQNKQTRPIPPWNGRTTQQKKPGSLEQSWLPTLMYLPLSGCFKKKKNSKLLYYLRHCIFSFLYSTV